MSSGEPAIEVTYYDGETQETSASLYAPAYLEGKDKYSYFLNGNKPLTVIRRQRDSWEEGQSGLGRLLLFKDSYAHCLIPFLVPHFQEIHVGICAIGERIR